LILALLELPRQLPHVRRTSLCLLHRRQVVHPCRRHQAVQPRLRLCLRQHRRPRRGPAAAQIFLQRHARGARLDPIPMTLQQHLCGLVDGTTGQIGAQSRNQCRHRRLELPGVAIDRQQPAAHLPHLLLLARQRHRHLQHRLRFGGRGRRRQTQRSDGARPLHPPRRQRRVGFLAVPPRAGEFRGDAGQVACQGTPAAAGLLA
jgi:hypothetical protein